VLAVGLPLRARLRERRPEPMGIAPAAPVPVPNDEPWGSWQAARKRPITARGAAKPKRKPKIDFRLIVRSLLQVVRREELFVSSKIPAKLRATLRAKVSE
jgi:hypothetical protein